MQSVLSESIIWSAKWFNKNLVFGLIFKLNEGIKVNQEADSAIINEWKGCKISLLIRAKCFNKELPSFVACDYYKNLYL